MDKKTYIHILADTLRRKNDLLDKLIQITLIQVESIEQVPPNMDGFEQALEDKEVSIEELSKLDDGFEKIYQHVQEELSINKNLHKEDILNLQHLIRDITDKGAKLQTLELNNKIKIENYFAGRKKEVKDFKISSQTATSYYKNMADQHQAGNSYFLDKKK